MKKVLTIIAAACCALAMSATTYTCHLKVNVNGSVSEQDEVQVLVNQTENGYDLSLNNFVLVADEQNKLPVGNIVVSGVEGVDEYGYTTIKYNAPINITAGDDPNYSATDWLGPMLGSVPIDLTARFIGTALSANIDINLGGMVIAVELFGVAPELKGDVNKDNEVNIADVNTVIGIILKN